MCPPGKPGPKGPTGPEGKRNTTDPFAPDYEYPDYLKDSCPIMYMIYPNGETFIFAVMEYFPPCPGCSAPCQNCQIPFTIQ